MLQRCWNAAESALLEPAARAYHYAQRKYDEAVKKGIVVPAEKEKVDRKLCGIF
jgi:hypothetical protein